MDRMLIDLALFLAGAAGGAALSYLKDRRLLHMYSDLVRQLSGALQEQVGALQKQVEHVLAAEAQAQSHQRRRQAGTIREDERVVSIGSLNP